MKKRISRIICTLLCCAPIAISAQTSEKITSPVNLYKEGKELFQEKNYAAAIPALKAFVKQKPTASLLQDAEYMLVSSAYELKDKTASSYCASTSTVIRILPMPTESIHCWLPATSTKGNMMRPWHSSILPGSICWEMRSATTAPTNWQPAT